MAITACDCTHCQRLDLEERQEQTQRVYSKGSSRQLLLDEIHSLIQAQSSEPIDPLIQNDDRLPIKKT